MFRDHLGTSSADFLWAVGIENTFVPQTRAGHRPLDEYELLDHYRLWRQGPRQGRRPRDFGDSLRHPLVQGRAVRGKFDWSWTDQVLEYLVEVKGLTPIVDLMHYGTPSWLDNGFVNASYPKRVADYARAFAERYAPLVKFYTPLNEPGVTASFCGRDGRWPPYLSGEDGYVKVLLALAKGMARTAVALRDARPDTILVHVEDVGIERAGTPAMAVEAAEAQARRLLPMDLACGRVVAGHPLYEGLLDNGAEERELHDLADAMPRWDVLGVNFYPWTNHRVVRRRKRRNRQARRPGRPRAWATSCASSTTATGLPVMVTETSAPGTHLERARWMADTLAEVREARASEIPVVGYTWFPMFTMIEWKYRWSRKGLRDHLLHLGLWDVVPEAGRLDRDPTPLVESYRRAAGDTIATVGEWPEAPTLLPLPQLVA